MRWFAISLLLVAGAVRAAEQGPILPCESEADMQAVLLDLEDARMTPERYGVLRNLVLRHGGKVPTTREWFGWASYGPQDNEIWWASQAFVADLAPEAERELLKRLVRIVDRMRHKGDNTPRVARGGEPFTALLALVDRIDAMAEEPKARCWLAGEASFLLHRYDLPRIPRDAISVVNEMREYPMWDPDTHENVAECDAWIGAFRTWLATYRKELEEGAAAEADTIEIARERMLAEGFCR